VSVEIPAAGYTAKVIRDWTVPQGADTTNALRYGTVTGETTTYPDLTTWTARAQIRDVVAGEVWVEFLSTSSSGPRIDLTDDGYVTVILPAATTEAWTDEQTRAVYDVELIKPDGTVIRLAMGKVKVSPDVTRTSGD